LSAIGGAPPSGKLAAEIEKTKVLQERLKRDQIREQTGIGRRRKQVEAALSRYGVAYSEEESLGDLELKLRAEVQKRNERRKEKAAENGPAERLTNKDGSLTERGKKMDAQKRTVKEEPKKGGESTRIREANKKAAKYEKGRAKQERAKVAKTSKVDDRTMDYIDVGQKFRDKKIQAARQRGAQS
jgi:hypothetical protein